jgi:hypothetical protein
VHLAGAPWLAEELQTIGVPASCVWLPSQLPTGDVPPLPNVFTVGSYIPDSRFEFYGGPLIYEAARRLPFVRFLIFGGQEGGSADRCRIFTFSAGLAIWDRYTRKLV